MELVYLWVEEYKNIHKQGFNFSPKFNCKYDPDSNKLIIDENDDYIENFFGDNINVTAIVGKNGSGKSSVLELIVNLDNPFSTKNKIVFIIKNKEKLFLYSINIEENIKSKKLKEIKLVKGSINDNTSKAIKSIGLNFAYMSLSPFLNNIDNLYNNIKDKKLLASIYNYKDDYINKTFSFIQFYLSMVSKIPSLLDNLYIKKLFCVQGKPTYLTFKLNKYIGEHFPNEFREIRKESHLIENLDESYVYEIQLYDLFTIREINELYEKIELVKKDVEEENFLLKEKLEKEESKELIPEPEKPIKTAFDRDYDALYNTPYGNSSDNKSMQSDSNKARNIRISHNRKKIIKNNKLIQNLGTIDFNLTQNKDGKDIFNFSSGELVLLFYIEKLIYMNQKEEDLIFLIDENELFMHPDWQKKFFLFLNSLFSNNKYKRHIIISSHSPFLLSDIPKENIIFLKDGKNDNGLHIQTFGANIHTLLSDSFFMEDGLMGEFAKQKIENLINFLQDKESDIKDHDEASKLIAIIGEPILQMKLEKMLEDYKLKKDIETEEDIQKQIDTLQMKLHQKKQQNG